MITHSLSEREKQAIDAILSQAEEEYLQIPNTSIEKIDDQCRSLWPDWDPNSIRSKQEIIDEQSIKLKKNSYNDLDNQYIKYDLDNQYIKYDLDSIHNNINEDTNEPINQENDMNTLRKGVVNLMSRINQTVELENPLQETESATISNKTYQLKKTKSSIQSSYAIDSSNSESGKEEIINKKKKKVKKSSAFSSSNSAYTDQSEVQQSIIIRPKNKIQAKQVIASTSRELKVVESENQMLKKRLAEMEVSFNEAQKEIRRLKQELRKSEAIRAKLTSSSTQNNKKPMKPRKKLEYVNRF